MSKYTFNKTQKLEEGAVMTYLNGLELVELWEKKRMVYNPEIQRGTVRVKLENGNFEDRPVVSLANIKKIKECMLNGTFYVSQLTLNVLKETAKFTYDNEKETITIEGDVLAISDGQHRIKALKEIKDEHPEFDLAKLRFPVKITHYNEEKAQEQFYQYTLGNKISTSRKEYFNHSNYANKIVKALYHDSVLKGKIENIKNTIGKKDQIKIVTFATLKSALELNFETNTIATDKEAQDIIDFLKKFFEKLLDVIPEFNDYESRTMLREENSLKCENITFYGYLAVAKFLFYQPDWEQKMNVLGEIDYTKDPNIWPTVVNVVKVASKDKKNGKVKKFTIVNNTQSRRALKDKMLRIFKEKVAGVA